MNVLVLEAPLDAVVDRGNIPLLLRRVRLHHQQRVGLLHLRPALQAELMLLEVLVECRVQLLRLNNGDFLLAVLPHAVPRLIPRLRERSGAKGLQRVQITSGTFLVARLALQQHVELSVVVEEERAHQLGRLQEFVADAEDAVANFDGIEGGVVVCHDGGVEAFDAASAPNARHHLTQHRLEFRLVYAQRIFQLVRLQRLELFVKFIENFALEQGTIEDESFGAEVHHHLQERRFTGEKKKKTLLEHFHIIQL